MVDKAKRLLSQANASRTVGGAAIIISGSYLLSRLLGLLREYLLVNHFGYGAEYSAYNAAFRLPELLFTLLVSGAFAVAFIPVLAGYLKEDKRKEAWNATATLLNLLVIGTLVAGVLMIIFADPLTKLVTPGFDESTQKLTADMTRIMAITPMLFAISSVLGSVQQAFNRFLIFSLAGVLYNIGIIIGILALIKPFGIMGAAYGVVLGVVLQALLQWLGLYGLGFKYKPVIMLRLKGVRTTLKNMVPRSIDQGIDQVHYLVETIIGSTISAAAIGQFAVANLLKNVPLVLIGGSITTAAFPRMATRAASGQREQLVDFYVQIARLILFLAIPAAVFAVVARGYIVGMIKPDVTAATTLGWFAGTIVFTSLFMLVSRVYYSMQDTRTPLYLSLISIPINIMLSFVLSKPYGVAGLAMAASIVAALETLALIVILHVRYGQFGERVIWRGAWRMLVAAGAMSIAVYPVVSQITPLYATDTVLDLIPKFMLILIVGIAGYLIPCYILQLNEAQNVTRRVKDILARQLNLT